MVEMTHDDQQAAFKLFVQHYNARKRTEGKKPKVGQGSVTMKQRAGRIDNNVQSKNVTINQTAKILKTVIGPEPETIGHNKELWLMIKAAHKRVVDARLKYNNDLEEPYAVVWNNFRREFKFDRKIEPSEWVQAQSEGRAPEFLKYFEDKYNKTRHGKTKRAQRRNGGIFELHDKRRDLCKKLNLSDEAFRDFLFKFKGVRSSSDLSLEEYGEILRMLEHQARYME